MPSQEELIRLKFQADTAALADSKAKSVALKAELAALKSELASGSITQAEYSAGWARLMRAFKDNAQEAKQLQNALGGIAPTAAKATASVDALDKATGKAKSGLAGFGQVGLQTGRVIQDFAQGGVAGILNNIEGLTQAIGGGPGLAGILTALGVGFFVLKPLIASFMDSLGGGTVKGFTNDLGELEKRIKELTDKPLRLAVEDIELANKLAQVEKMKKAAEAYRAAIEGRSTVEASRGTAVAGALAEYDEEGIARTLHAQAGERLMAGDKELQESMRELPRAQAALEASRRKNAGNAAIQFGVARVERFKEEIAKRKEALAGEGKDSEATQAVGALLGLAKRGKKEDVDVLVRELKKGGFGQAAGGVEFMAGEVDQPDADEAREEQDKRFEVAKKKRQIAKAKADHEADMLTHAGIENVFHEKTRREQEAKQQAAKDIQAQNQYQARIKREAGRFGAGAAGPVAEAERFLLQQQMGRQQGMPGAMGEEAAVGAAAKEIAARMRRSGARDEGGRPLNRIEIQNIAQAIAAKAQEELGNDITGMVGQTNDLQAAQSAVMQMLVNKWQEQRAQVGQLFMQANGMMRQLQAAGRPNINRGG